METTVVPSILLGLSEHCRFLKMLLIKVVTPRQQSIPIHLAIPLFTSSCWLNIHLNTAFFLSVADELVQRRQGYPGRQLVPSITTQWPSAATHTTHLQHYDSALDRPLHGLQTDEAIRGHDSIRLLCSHQRTRF